MTDNSKNPAGAGSDDPWEQLAEDLFGLEFGKEHSAGNTSGAVTSAPEQPARAPEPAPVPSAVEFTPEPDVVEPVRASGPVFEEPAEEPQPGASAPPSPQDSYWDALANWNWDDGESSGTRGKRPEPREERRSGDRPRDEGRSAPAAPRSSERAAPPPRREAPEPRRGSPRAGGSDFGAVPDEPVWGDVPESRVPVSESSASDDDFGGIDDEDESDAPEAAGEFAEAEGEGGRDEGAPKKRRRRRRRRRSRPGETEASASGPAPTAAAPADIPGDDWSDDEEALPPTPVQPETQRPAPPARADRERSRDRDEEGPRRSRRRRGDRDRDRGERSDRDRGRREPAPAADLAGAPDDEFSSGVDEVLISSPGASPGDFESEEDSLEARMSYEDVPTWEEAISYLLHPNQVQVEGSGGGSPGPRGAPPPPTDQPRQTRHYGGRRR